MRAEDEYKDNNGYKQGSRGSLTVEALLFLIPFIMAFCTLINAARFVQAEMLIHHAATQTAKQVSVYSYVLTKTKITDRIIETNKKSQEMKVTIEKATSSLEGFVNAISHMDDLAEDVFSMIPQKGEQEALTFCIGKLTKNNIKNELSLITENPDEFLENIGIKGGLSGLRFSNTKCFDNTEGKGEVKIVVDYTMENILFPDFDFGEYEFCQCAYTLIW